MSKLICLDCGEIFDEDELDSYEECVGEYWGTPAYETFGICPNCQSDAWEDLCFTIVNKDTGEEVSHWPFEENALKDCEQWNEDDPENEYVVIDNLGREV